MRLTRYIIAFDIAVVVAAILLAAATDRPLKTGFAEYRPVTLLSTLQLAVISIVLFRLWRRVSSPGNALLRSNSLVWLLLAAGFMFLAADELFQVHERLDFAIHDILGITETKLTDHLDEAILLTYFVVGLAVLFRFRSEFLDRPGIKLALTGIAFFAVSLVLDAILNGSEIGDTVGVPLSIMEETSELMAEAFFLGYAALRLRLAHKSEASAGPESTVQSQTVLR